MLTKFNASVITKIAQRAEKMGIRTQSNCFMDLSGMKQSMDFDSLLKANNVDFIHDINGIGYNLNHDTMELENCFLPRFSDTLLTNLQKLEKLYILLNKVNLACHLIKKGYDYYLAIDLQHNGTANENFILNGINELFFIGFDNELINVNTLVIQNNKNGFTFIINGTLSRYYNFI